VVVVHGGLEWVICGGCADAEAFDEAVRDWVANKTTVLLPVTAHDRHCLLCQVPLPADTSLEHCPLCCLEVCCGNEDWTLPLDDEVPLGVPCPGEEFVPF
jgi:hypothetical protein